MAPRSRKPDAAKLGHRIWDHLRDRAENLPGEFTPDARDDVTGWLWEGAVASVIREAIPGIADSDLRRAPEYLSASGMVVNVGGYQRGGGQPRWFIRSSWYQGPGGHVHVVPAHRSGQPAAPAASQPAADNGPGELARQPRQDIVKALQSLIQQVSGLQSDNDRLRVDNDRLSTEIERIRALMLEAGGEIARRANQLLADTEGQRPPTSEPSSLKLHSCRGLLRCTPARSAVPPRPSGGILASGDDVKSVPASRHRRCCSARTVQPEPGG
jgi:hypothetical protein